MIASRDSGATQKGRFAAKHISAHQPMCRKCTVGTHQIVANQRRRLGEKSRPATVLAGDRRRTAARPAFSRILCLAQCLLTATWLQRDPDSAIPESPTIRVGVPCDGCPRRPHRWRRLRHRPRRRYLVAIAGAEVVVPVMAVIPVRVTAPALVPAVARAPVMVIRRCGKRRRLGGACGQAESRQG